MLVQHRSEDNTHGTVGATGSGVTLTSKLSQRPLASLAIVLASNGAINIISAQRRSYKSGDNVYYMCMYKLIKNLMIYHEPNYRLVT